MKINRVNSVSFTSKNVVLRNLDDITRRFMQEFSKTKSSTKVQLKLDTFSFANCKKPEIKSDINNVAEIMRERIGFIRNAVEQPHRGKTYEKMIKKGGYANCGELSTILEKRLKKEGYNVERVSSQIHQAWWKRPIRQMCDHVFLVVNRKPDSDIVNPKTWGTKAIVVDPWSGIVDYSNNALAKLEKYLDIDKNSESLRFD